MVILKTLSYYYNIYNIEYSITSNIYISSSSDTKIIYFENLIAEQFSEKNV